MPLASPSPFMAALTPGSQFGFERSNYRTC